LTEKWLFLVRSNTQVLELWDGRVDIALPLTPMTPASGLQTQEWINPRPLTPATPVLGLQDGHLDFTLLLKSNTQKAW
jgi:hypothetical protein